MRKQATRLLYAAYSKGVNTWDTANAYSNGMSEATIGQAIKEYNIPRRKLVLMTKVGRIMADPESSESGDFVAFLDDEVRKSKDYTNQYGNKSSPLVGPCALTDSTKACQDPPSSLQWTNRLTVCKHPISMFSMCTDTTTRCRQKRL